MDLTTNPQLLAQADAIGLMRNNSLPYLDAVKALADQGLSSRQIGQLIQRRDDQVRHTIRVARKLSTMGRRRLKQGLLSFSHARVVVSAGSEAEQDKMILDLAGKSVREAEQQLAARQGRAKQSKPSMPRLDDAARQYYERLGQQLSEQTALDVRMLPDPRDTRKGYVALRYSSLEHFEAILCALGVVLENDE